MQQKTNRVSGIAFISRTQIVLYIQGMATQFAIPFPPDVIRDLDIIDQTKLASLLQATIAQQKIPPASITLLLANDLLFAKQMMNNDISAQNLEEQAFVDMVPYEDVGVRRIPFNNGIYITVANKDLYEGIIKAFEANNFITPLVLAAYIFSTDVNFASALTPSSLTLLMQKAPSYKQFNFLQKEVIVKAPEEKIPESHGSDTVEVQKDPPPPKSNRVFILSGVFIMLIGVLIAVYLWSSQANEPIRKATPTPVSKASVASPEPTLSEKSPETENVESATDVLIILKFSGEESQNAVLIEDSLEKDGFRKIAREEATSSNDTIISFDNSIPDVVKNKIISAVSRVYEKVIIQNSNSFPTPVTIQLSTD